MLGGILIKWLVWEGEKMSCLVSSQISYDRDHTLPHIGVLQATTLVNEPGAAKGCLHQVPNERVGTGSYYWQWGKTAGGHLNAQSFSLQACFCSTQLKSGNDMRQTIKQPTYYTKLKISHTYTQNPYYIVGKNIGIHVLWGSDCHYFMRGVTTQGVNWFT